MVDAASSGGDPSPLGVSWSRERSAYNFALYGRHARAVTLLLYRDGEYAVPAREVPLPFTSNKTGRVWHAAVPEAEIGDARYYAYRVDGPNGAPNGGNFDATKILLDPYSRGVFFPPDHSRAAACRPGSNAGQAPLGILRKSLPDFDWGGDRRPRRGANAIIYELHVRGFTMHASAPVDPRHRGTYLGVVDMIPHLLDLGVNVVELMPVHQFDPDEGNFFGYMPLNFFSPHARYATDATPDTALNEFRQMVKALHAAGIEVVLDVVFNHTTESSARGPTYSWRGIDNGTYYLLETDMRTYRDYSSTGNTLRCSHPAVEQMICDSLRFWVSEMHVDGFRFDLATILAVDVAGAPVSAESPEPVKPTVLSTIAQDPVLSDLRMIAEPWAAMVDNLYMLGRSFPAGTWQQWNQDFRNKARDFVRGLPNTVGGAGIALRLYGSDDKFPPALPDVHLASQSVNYIASHDGFCLYDTVAYNAPRDDASDEHSWDCGHDGDANVPPDVRALRLRQAKNLFCLLLLANGTPMILAGDEFLRTMRGNRNPYGQDNDVTWIDWTRRAAHADVQRFVRELIRFRGAHPFIANPRFWPAMPCFGVNGPQDWSADAHAIAIAFDGAPTQSADLYAMFNAYWEPLTFTIQWDGAATWRRAIDTSLDSPDDIDQNGVALAGLQYDVRPRSCVVLCRPRGGLFPNDDTSAPAREPSR